MKTDNPRSNRSKLFLVLKPGPILKQESVSQSFGGCQELGQERWFRRFKNSNPKVLQLYDRSTRPKFLIQVSWQIEVRGGSFQT